MIVDSVDPGGRLGRSDCIGAALLLALAILFFLPVTLDPNQLLYPVYSRFSDLTVIHWPNAIQLRETYARFHEIPLWSNVGLSGMPAIANPLAMLFYPPNLVLTHLPLGPGFNLLTGLHVFVAGLGMYLHARLALRRSQAAAVLAATAYMFSGKLLVHIAGGHMSLIAAAAWVPWVLLGVQQTLSRASLIVSALTGIALALQVVTHTQIVIYTVYGLVFYAAWELVALARRDGIGIRGVLSRALLLAPMGVVALALGAVQILPLAELAGQSNRALSLAEASQYSLSVVQALSGILLPGSQVGHELTIYPGLIVLALACAALPVARRNSQAAFLVALAVLAVWVSLGSSAQLLSALYRVAPGWSWLRAAARSWFFVSFALAGLAAYGLDEVRAGTFSRTGLRVAGLLAFACLLFGVGLVYGYGQINRAVLGLALLPVVFVAVIALRALGKLGAPATTVLILLLALVDLSSFGRSLFVLRSAGEVIGERAELARYFVDSRDVRDPFRTYSPSYSIPKHVAALNELETADGVEPVHLAHYDRFMPRAGGYESGGFSVTVPPFDGPIETMYRDAHPDPALLGLLNVRFVAAEFPLRVEGLEEEKRVGSTWVYRNRRELPRSFAVFNARAAGDEETAFRLLGDIDPAREAVVEGSSALTEETSAPLVPAAVVLHTPNKIVTEIDMPLPGTLILSEMWYPGWKAYDNGRPIPVVRADYLLRAVQLDAGQHTVAWVYQPDSLGRGRRITAFGALLTALALAFGAWRGAMRRLRDAGRA